MRERDGVAEQTLSTANAGHSKGTLTVRSLVVVRERSSDGVAGRSECRGHDDEAR